MAIDGLVSGLNTTTIIESLMALERAPQTQLTNRKATTQAAVDALESISTRLTSLQTAATALQRSTGWNLRTATSSNPTALAATAAAGATAASLTFTVDRLATAHSLATAVEVASANTVIASGGSIGLTVGGDAHVVSVGSGTLTEVANSINAAGIGVRAAVVSTGTGYRLQLSSSTTGDDGVFTVDSGLDGLVGGTVVTSAGADARIVMGTGPGAYGITSSTNTFANVLPGVTIQVKAPSATAITVDVSADTEGLAGKVAAMVDAANATLAEIAARTAYDPKTKVAASLAGDGAARKISQSILRAVSDAVSSATAGAPAAVGISLDRFGTIGFDRAKFLDAYAKDPTGVEKMFTQTGSATTADVSFVSAGDRTAPGTYEVVATSFATQAASTGLDAITWPADAEHVVKVRIGSNEITHTIQIGDTAADAALGIQAAFNGAGLALIATEAGGGLEIRTSAVGSSAVFEVAWDGATWAAATGTNATGTIGGADATGVANILTVPGTVAEIGGLSAQLNGNTVGAVGSVTYVPGIAQRLASAVAAAIDPVSGLLTSATETRQNRIDNLNKAIDSYEVRLLKREALLRKQYSALEAALGALKSQSEWLAGQLSGLSANSAANNK